MFKCNANCTIGARHPVGFFSTSFLSDFTHVDCDVCINALRRVFRIIITTSYVLYTRLEYIMSRGGNFRFGRVFFFSILRHALGGIHTRFAPRTRDSAPHVSSSVNTTRKKPRLREHPPFLFLSGLSLLPRRSRRT